MENNIKETIEAIDVPMEKLDAAIFAGVEQEKIKHKPRKLQIIALASIASMSLLVGSGFVSPTIASVLANVPFIGPMFSIEEDHKGLQVALNDANTVTLNKTVTSEGISITFEKIVYDGERISIIFSLDEYMDIWPVSLYVDNQLINNDESLRELDGDGRFRGLWEFVAEEPLPDAFDFKLQVSYIDGIQGDWQFTTPIKKVKNDQQIIAVEQKGELSNVSYEIQSVTRSNTSTTVTVKYGMTLEEQYTAGNFVEAKVFDEAGMPLQLIDIQTDIEGKYMVTSYIYEPTATNNLVVYVFKTSLVNDKIAENMEPLQNALPQTLSLGDYGEIRIVDAKQNGFEQTLTLHVVSDLPFDHLLSPLGIDILNEAGESIVTKWPRAISPNQYEISYQGNVDKAVVRTIDLTNVHLELTPKHSISLQ